jgi:hypothetical protein
MSICSFFVWVRRSLVIAEQSCLCCRKAVPFGRYLSSSHAYQLSIYLKLSIWLSTLTTRHSLAVAEVRRSPNYDIVIFRFLELMTEYERN